jgi:hypothetical protein
MKKIRLSSLILTGTVVGLGMAASLLWSQQAKMPAPPRPPPQPLTLAELEAIPLVPPRAGETVTKTLFDGKTLDGWRGNFDWWSVKDGAIAGKLSENVTSFLFTKDNYSDFRLTLSSRMVESENHGGVCFWGEIVEQGATKWFTHGPVLNVPDPSLWDYNGGAGLRVYLTTTEKVARSYHEWVKIEILAQGNRMRAAFNGVQVMEWRAADLSRIKDGPIGVQLHGFRGPQEVLYKDIVVETFPKEDKLITLLR